MENSKEFGDRLRKALKVKGLTQIEAANLISITKNAMNNYVQGRIPETTILYKLALLCSVSMEWLLSGQGKGPDEMLTVSAGGQTGPPGQQPECPYDADYAVAGQLSEAHIDYKEHTDRNLIRIEVTEDEKVLLDMYRSMDEKLKLAALEVIDTLNARLTPPGASKKAASSISGHGEEAAAKAG